MRWCCGPEGRRNLQPWGLGERKGVCFRGHNRLSTRSCKWLTCPVHVLHRLLVGVVSQCPRHLPSSCLSVQEKDLKGWVGCHTSHQYQYGCCMYFTFGGVQQGPHDINTFLGLKQAATEAILRNGGMGGHHV